MRAAPADGKAKHPDNIPKPSGFILAGDTGRDGNELLEHAPREKHGKRDARLAGGRADFDLQAVGDGLLAGVAVDDGADWLGFLVADIDAP